MIRVPDVFETLSVLCECGTTINSTLRHYEHARCACGIIYTALRPKRDGPMKLYVWAGDRPITEVVPVWETTYIVTDDQAGPIARIRQKAHDTNRTPRFFEDKLQEEVMGVKGEWGFEEMTGYPMDRNGYVHGDRLIDFRVWIKGKLYTVDVKTARKPTFLFVKHQHIDRCADYLVQAKYTGDKIQFIGWSTRPVMQGQPHKDFGYGIDNHYLEAEKLYPMKRLLELIETQKRTSKERELAL